MTHGVGRGGGGEPRVDDLRTDGDPGAALPATCAVWERPPGIKVCGCTRLEDVRLAADLGAWAVGFAFSSGPRQVTCAHALRLMGGLKEGRAVAVDGRVPATRRPLAVGVFQDAPPELVARVVCDVGLDAVELHGEESPYQVRRICAAAEQALVIKVISVEHGTTAVASIVARVQAIAPHVDAVSLDTRVRDRIGGTGVNYRWELARPVVGYLPVLVAGGIRPDNVREALEVSGAWGVSVCGGVESSPGVKDPGLLRALFSAVRMP